MFEDLIDCKLQPQLWAEGERRLQVGACEISGNAELLRCQGEFCVRSRFSPSWSTRTLPDPEAIHLKDPSEAISAQFTIYFRGRPRSEGSHGVMQQPRHLEGHDPNLHQYQVPIPVRTPASQHHPKEKHPRAEIAKALNLSTPTWVEL